MDLLSKDDKGKKFPEMRASKQTDGGHSKPNSQSRESFWTSSAVTLRCHDGITKCRIAAAPSLRAFCPERFIV
jgi:hypothetical protein